MRSHLYIFTLVLIMISTACQSQKNHPVRLRLNFGQGEVPSLHPHMLVSHMRGHSLGKLLYEGLCRIDSEGIPVLAGAQEMRVGNQGKRYVFTLKKQHWSDGSQVTAYDYVAAWQQALAPGTHCLRPDLFYLIRNGQKAKKGEVPIERIGVRAHDPLTLEVELEYFSPYFLHLLAHPASAPLKTPEEEPTCFNGPYQVKRWDKGKRMELEPNRYFWDKDSIHINSIEISCVQDPGTAYYMFEKQEIDWVGDPFDQLPQETAVELREKQQVSSQPVDRFYWIYLNTQHPLLQSTKIRQALSLSINRKEVTEHICIGEPLLAPVHHGMIPLEIEEEGLETALSLFREGLKELKLDSIPPLTLSYVHFGNQKSLVEYLKNKWERAFGIEVRLHGSEYNVFRQNLERGEFEIGGCFASSFYGDPLEMLGRFEELGITNFCQWDNVLFQKKLSLVRQETESQRRLDLLTEAENILVEDSPIIPLLRCIHLYAHHPQLKGYVFDGGGCVDFAYAYFEKPS